MRYLILGCGWIGEAFARQLKTRGYEVYATTTQVEKYHRLQADGIFAIQTNFDSEVDFDQFPAEVDYVLTSVPASQRFESDLLEVRFQAVAQLLHTLVYKKHIFLSSIGIYPDTDAVFTEAGPLLEDSNLAAAERAMLALAHTHVYRLGGLFGQERIFAKYFEGKVCTTGDQLANFVHQDDVVELLQLGFEKEVTAAVYNVVAPEHPTKKEVILASAKKYGFQEPAAFEPADSFQKLVLGEALTNALRYTYIYPSPLTF